MRRKEIELVRIMICLRDEYRRIQNTLEQLKRLIELNPEKYKDCYLGISKAYKDLSINLNLIKQGLSPRKRLADLIMGKQEPTSRTIALDKTGAVKIDNCSSLLVRDEEQFTQLFMELVNDPFLKGYFNNLAVIGYQAFRIKPSETILSDDTYEVSYNGHHDAIRLLAEDIYHISRQETLALLNTKIPTEYISSEKQRLISKSDNYNKKIVFDSDLDYTILPNQTAILKLGIDTVTSDNTVRISKKR